MAVRKGTNVNNFFTAGAGGEQFDGLLGYDIVSYATATAGVTIDVVNAALNRGAALGDTFTSIEAYRLSTFNDTFDGGAAVESVNGGFGDDDIDGRGGNDQLAGHNGNDRLTGSLGNDGLWGGGGNDIISGGDGDDKAYGDSGNDLINGGNGNDSITGSFDAGRMTGTVAETTAAFKGTDGVAVSLSVAPAQGNAFVLQGWQGHNGWAANEIPLTKVGEADGESFYVFTNNTGAAVTNWGFHVKDSAGVWQHAGSFSGSNPTTLQPGQSLLVNMGALGTDGGLPRPIVVDLWGNFYGIKEGSYNATDAQMSSNAIGGGVSITLKSLVIGDTLTGGAGADTFIFAMAHGVDRITDFAAGVDKIDLANTWFDGNAANGEFKVASHANGAVIVFTDSSVDGLVDNAAIQLAGISAASVNASFFI